MVKLLAKVKAMVVEVTDLVIEVKAPMVVLMEVKVLVINNTLGVPSAFPQTLLCSLSNMSMESLSMKPSSTIASFNGAPSVSAGPLPTILVLMLVGKEEGTMEEAILIQEKPLSSLVSFLIPVCG